MKLYPPQVEVPSLPDLQRPHTETVLGMRARAERPPRRVEVPRVRGLQWPGRFQLCELQIQEPRGGPADGHLNWRVGLGLRGEPMSRDENISD